MDNRITSAWKTFIDAWQSVTTTLQSDRSDDFSERYSLVMSLDGEVIERATVSIIHLESPGQIDTVIARFENSIPRLEAEDELSHNIHRLESRFAQLYEHGRSMKLRDALAAEGIVVNHMTTHNGPKK